MPENQELIQEQGVGQAETFTHCRRCRRGFKVPKNVPYGPKCAKIMQNRMNDVKEAV